MSTSPTPPVRDTLAGPRPSPGTLERWCWDFVLATDLTAKLRPPTPPPVHADDSWQRGFRPLRLQEPGRPPELRVTERSPRTPANLAQKSARASLIHTFLHHELQAAELFAWALLAFPETPRAFRAGLVRLCLEELEHLSLYAEHLGQLGSEVGAFPVRDWFWRRVGSCESAVAFIALQGVGLEGANLEHSRRFAGQFRAAGDDAGADIMQRVENDEVGHVRFAIRWLEKLSGAPLDYDTWRSSLPAPLTPSVLQGRPLNRAARIRAGLNDDFLRRLEAEPSTSERRAR